MSKELHAVIMVLIAVLVTAALRAIPFLIFGKGREMPPFIRKAADRLPPAIMAILVLYCIWEPLAADPGSALISLFAVLFTAAVHLYRKNTLLSIFLGTALYMVLIRVF